ncbi:MAG: DUF2256 domain-containing protein [Chitinophagaceae bacterium]
MKTRKKINLPARTCVICNRPFVWRKKWEKNWEEVKYCSDKCRMNRNTKSADRKPVSGN